jgi:hypothetical protein
VIDGHQRLTIRTCEPYRSDMKSGLSYAHIRRTLVSRSRPRASGPPRRVEPANNPIS